MNALDISVVIGTYNRCDMLPRALEGVLGQEAGNVRYEVIVVDNNSIDRTREVVGTLIESGETGLRYVFEAKQGLAHARNAGIAVARAPIIAFTDDDVRVAPSWIAEIKRALDDHPEVDSVGGRILPRWPCEPPAWLTREHWVGPLALQEYGPVPFHVNAERPLSLAGANLAFRRSVFERLGGFAPAFSEGGDHSDTEMLIRLYRNDLQSLYAPNILVTAEVQPERLRKRYHRRWFFRAGRVQALMRFAEIFDRDGRLDEDRVGEETLFGTPACIYRALLTEGAGWLGATVRRQESVALTHENRFRYLVGYVSGRYEQTRRERSRWCVAEVWIFALSVLKRKSRKVFQRVPGGAARLPASAPRKGGTEPRPSPNGDKDVPD
jgi:glycosyltransferase involved in cell wall biosynthesis